MKTSPREFKPSSVIFSHLFLKISQRAQIAFIYSSKPRSMDCKELRFPRLAPMLLKP